MDALNAFCRAFCPYGGMDIEMACDIAGRIGFFPSDIVDWINEYVDGTGMAVGDIDCVYIVYKKLWDIAEDEIFSSIITIDDKMINEPGENLLENYVQIFSNYLDSSIYIINGKEEEFTKIVAEYLKNCDGNIPRFMWEFFDELNIDSESIVNDLRYPTQTPTNS